MSSRVMLSMRSFEGFFFILGRGVGCFVRIDSRHNDDIRGFGVGRRVIFEIMVVSRVGLFAYSLYEYARDKNVTNFADDCGVKNKRIKTPWSRA